MRSDGECVADGNGTIWARDSQKNLIRLTGTNFAALPSDSGWSKTRVNCLTTNSAGQLSVGTDAGIVAMWDGNHFEDATPTNSSLPAEVTFLTPAKDGGLWPWSMVPSAKRWAEVGFLKLNRSKMFSRIIGSQTRRAGRSSRRRLSFYGYGRVGQGLWHVAADGKTQMLGSQEEFSGARVNCYFEDREGNMWVGFGTGGLMRIRPQRFQTVDAGGIFRPDRRGRFAKKTATAPSGSARWAMAWNAGSRGRSTQLATCPAKWAAPFHFVCARTRAAACG